MGKTTEVKARLRVEDGGSSGVLAKIKQGFLGAGDAAQTAGEHASSFAEQIAAVAIGEKIGDLADKVVELGKSFFEAGIEGQRADKAIAGLILNAQGGSWNAAISAAQQLGDELDDISVMAGQAGDDVGAAFEVMVEIGGATAEGITKAKEQTESLAIIANTLGKSTADIAREFSFMGEGVVKTKGQLFQLLQSTGIFGDKTKNAAAYWAKMTDESRTASLAYGLEKVASTLNESEPVIGDYLTTIGNLFDMTKEKLGEPIINEMRPVLQDLIGKLKQAMPQIEKFGIMLGKEMADWVEEATKAIEDGFEYIETHSEEIKNAIVEGYKTAKEVVLWILDHKEEIAIAFGAKAAMPGLKAAGGVASAVFNAGAAGGAVTGFGSLGGIGAAGGLAAGGGAVLAFTAAVAAFALAAYAFNEAVEQSESFGARGDFNADTAHFKQMAAAPDMGAKSEADIKEFERIRAAYVKTAEELGENSRAAGALADSAWAAHRTVREMVAPVEEAQKMFDNFAKARAAGVIPDEQSIATADALIGQVGASFTKAMATQNAGAQQYIANLLAKSEGLQGAFLASANLTSEGFEALASMVESQSSEFAELLRGRAAEGKKGAATPAAPKVVMTGGQTFNVKQDFRDQDPDRVAITFERDIGRSIERKLSAGSSVFGG